MMTDQKPTKNLVVTGIDEFLAIDFNKEESGSSVHWVNKGTESLKTDSEHAGYPNSSNSSKPGLEEFKKNAGSESGYIKKPNSSNSSLGTSTFLPHGIRKMGVGRGRFVISSDYRIDWVERFRKIPGKAWDGDKKEWSFPLSSVEAFKRLFPEVPLSSEVMTRAAQMINPKENLRDMPDIQSFTGVLYPFQKEGVRFLITGRKVFLCDDMGTGKTVMSIAAACALMEEGEVNKTLVICPSSLKHQWIREITRFTNMSHIKISGTIATRKKAWEIALNHDFIIINYEMTINSMDSEYINDMCNRFNVALILDEATRIKSFKAKRTKAMKRLDAPVKFLLTGTPVENTPAELYSLNQFLDNERLGKWSEFETRYLYKNDKGWIVGFRNLEELHVLIQGIMLRRRKSEVLTDLPEKIVNRYDVEMSKDEYEDYNNIVEVILRHLKGSEEAEMSGDEEQMDVHLRAMFQSIVFCKMYCDHPDLLRMSKSEQIEKLDIKAKKSSKLEELKLIVDDIVSGGNKVVIFTQYVEMAKIISREIPGVVLYHGSMSEKDRDEAIDIFSWSKELNVLCSTDAGSHGLNLQGAASYVVNYDLPWNPSILNQRIDRLHRMGQTRVVNVINLVISDYETIEERITQVLRKKQRMFEKVVDGRISE